MIGARAPHTLGRGRPRYNKLSRRFGAIDSKARKLAKRILKTESIDRMGDGIHAAAALVLDEPSYMDREAGTVLRQLAELAGFSVSANSQS
jgi:hypothetical protein